MDNWRTIHVSSSNEISRSPVLLVFPVSRIEAFLVISFRKDLQPQSETERQSRYKHGSMGTDLHTVCEIFAVMVI